MNVTKELFDELIRLSNAELDENGHELLNPKPIAIAADLQRPLTMDERIQRAIGQAVSRQAQMQGRETFEEANDFDIDDENPMPISGYEVVDMTPETPRDPQTNKNTSPLSEGSGATTGEAGISEASPNEANKDSSPSPVEETPPPEG